MLHQFKKKIHAIKVEKEFGKKPTEKCPLCHERSLFRIAKTGDTECALCKGKFFVKNGKVVKIK